MHSPRTISDGHADALAEARHQANLDCSGDDYEEWLEEGGWKEELECVKKDRDRLLDKFFDAHKEISRLKDEIERLRKIEVKYNFGLLKQEAARRADEARAASEERARVHKKARL